MFLELTNHYASDYSVLLAIVDLIPVVLFLLTGIILLKNLYGKLSGLSYSLIASGTIMVFTAGLLKAIWKFIAAVGICDFVVFNLLFLPISGIGFTLFALGLIDLFKKKDTKVLSIGVIPLFAIAGEEALEMKYTSLPFIILQTLSCSALMIMLFIFSIKNNKKLAAIFIVIAFISMWGMGGLAALDGKMNVTLWNWLEEIVNTVSQATLLVGVYYLFKKE